MSNLGKIHPVHVVPVHSISCINEYFTVDTGGYLYKSSVVF